MMDNVGRFQAFEFRLANFKFFWVKAVGFGKNWWVVYLCGYGAPFHGKDWAPHP
jgi:hypothetical protein